MTDHAQARNNMVECQIRPNGVYNERILDVFRTIPREHFLPENMHAKAYVDEDISLEGTSFMMEPMILARMVQSLEPQEDDVALILNDCTGYASAVLSELVSTVLSLDSSDTDLKTAKKVWDDLECNNIAVFQSKVKEGDSEHGPYDLIFIHGAVSEIPSNLQDQLKIGGRLVVVVRPDHTDFGSVTLVQRVNANDYSTNRIFDAASFYVSGMEPEAEFQF